MPPARFVVISLFITLTMVLSLRASAAGLVNINTATAAQLDVLPGIGQTKAQAILDYRTLHGLFATPADIQKVKGIGPATYEKLKAQITVGEGASKTNTTQPPLTQPVVQPVSYTKVQKIESKPITNTTHDDAVVAPAAAPQLAAAGAAQTLEAPGRVERISHSPFQSVWMYGLVGVILMAGGAFIFL